MFKGQMPQTAATTPTTTDDAGTTSDRGLAGAPTSLGFDSTWWMVVVWLVVIVLARYPYPGW